MKLRTDLENILVGKAIGEAIGIPHYNISRFTLKVFPVRGMRPSESLEQPAGTWGNNTSLACCFTDMLSTGYNLDVLKKNFLLWYRENKWTSSGDLLQMDQNTRKWISFLSGIPADSVSSLSGNCSSSSLSWILPVISVYKRKYSLYDRFWFIQNLSKITHSDSLSQICAFYLTEFAWMLSLGRDVHTAFNCTNDEIRDLTKVWSFPVELDKPLEFLIYGIISCKEEYDIKSTDAPLDILQASIWSMLRSNSYEEAVLQAVNLGKATDVIGAVTGALAGLYYGTENLPQHWTSKIPRLEEIKLLAKDVHQKYNGTAVPERKKKKAFKVPGQPEVPLKALQFV